MANSEHMTAAELERDVEAQRQRIERRIGEIQERLSPGQLIDEALAHTRSGGAKFASALGEDVAANPIPTALLGVSLAWLIAGAGARRNGHDRWASHADTQRYPDTHYPYATIKSGGLRRISHKEKSPGEWMSEFVDDTGRTFHAKADELGHRTGHFVDDSGKTVSGFIDDAGQRVTDFRDEAGMHLDEAMGWASHTWRDASEAVQHAADSAATGLRRAGEGAQDMASGAAHMASDAAHGARRMASGASHAAGDMSAQTEQLARQLMRALEDQPLVAGALAFAAGAAVGAALPHTAEEDAMFGETSDQMRESAAKMAEEFYEEGKKKVGALYEEGKEQVEKAYDDAARQAEESYKKAKDYVPGNGQSPDLH